MPTLVGVGAFPFIARSNHKREWEQAYSTPSFPIAGKKNGLLFVQNESQRSADTETQAFGLESLPNPYGGSTMTASLYDTKKSEGVWRHPFASNRASIRAVIVILFRQNVNPVFSADFHMENPNLRDKAEIRIRRYTKTKIFAESVVATRAKPWGSDLPGKSEVWQPWLRIGRILIQKLTAN